VMATKPAAPKTPAVRLMNEGGAAAPGFMQNPVGWVKANPMTAGAVALGAAALVAGVVYMKRRKD